MTIKQIDHIVLTVKNIEETIQFYCNILGMELITFGDHRKALSFGNQKLNLHLEGNEFEPKAKFPMSGSIDLCLIVSENIELIKTELQNKGIKIIEGIVLRTGATGKIKSIYMRDPDANLIEISNYI